MNNKGSKLSADFGGIIFVRDVLEDLATERYFDASHEDSSSSPIDLFIENSTRLNKLWVTRDPEETLEPELSVMLTLGYVSAVESFMRALIRRVVEIDLHAQVGCETYVLTFAAAKNHKQAMLPEALLEETVFSGAKGLKDGLKKFIGIEVNSSGLNKLLDHYVKVCEIRHCCVHRFGKLGTKNAVQLGLDKHKKLLEKPLQLRTKDVASIADLLFSLVKAINNEIFGFLLRRSAVMKLPKSEAVGIGWTWNWQKDRKKYMEYYNIFCSALDEKPSPPARELYDRFRDVLGRSKISNNGKSKSTSKAA